MPGSFSSSESSILPVRGSSGSLLYSVDDAPRIAAAKFRLYRMGRLCFLHVAPDTPMPSDAVLLPGAESSTNVDIGSGCVRSHTTPLPSSLHRLCSNCESKTSCHAPPFEKTCACIVSKRCTSSHCATGNNGFCKADVVFA